MAHVVVVGGSNVDVVARPDARPVAATSNPGRVTVTPGGVGRNVAENLARLGTPCHLVSAVGADAHGDLVLAATSAAGVDVEHVRRVPAATGTYLALLDDAGELVGAVSDMAATAHLTPEDVDGTPIATAALVVLDGNLAPATLQAAWDAALAAGVPVALDPVSVPKAAALDAHRQGRALRLLSAGTAELAVLTHPDADIVWERRGAAGSTLTADGHRVDLPVVPADVRDVTGAGDAMLAAFCHALLGGAAPAEAAAYGHAAAALTVATRHAVRPDLSDELVEEPAVNAPVELTDEVATALAEGRPVVALESTIISHGMPYPDNVAMAVEVEGIVRDGGAVPATIAVLGGVPRVGLSPDDLELLASDPGVGKASVRDLPYVVARGLHGATTVAATMRLASLAGIEVFVTGGLGGVHRGASESFDVSADLTELASTPVTVVCAGVKSILDIALTLETLETNGVPVLVHGSDEFPAFYSRSSGHAAPARVESATEAAAVSAAARRLGLRSGIVVANPIPPADEIPADEIDAVIDRALADHDALGIGGKDVTPYLLRRIVELTDGASLVANIALVRHNARFGAAMAAARPAG